MTEHSQAPLPNASLLRRLAAMFYDTLLLLGIWFLAGLLALPFQGNETSQADGYPLGYLLYLLAVTFLFFHWFWTHGGQTLGMVSWRIRVQRMDGTPLTLRQTLLRFIAAAVSLAAGGLGFLWILFDKDHMAWHDRWSGTHVVVIPKKK